VAGRAVTLITGASAGLGAEFARQCAARGEKLALLARRRDRLEALKAELGGDVTIFAADLSLPGAPTDLLAQMRAGGLEIDCLINNAGFGLAGGSTPTRRAPDGDDRPQHPGADRTQPRRPPGHDRTAARRHPQRGVDRRLSAGAAHGSLLRDQGLCALLYRGAAPGAEGQRGEGQRFVPRAGRHRILRCRQRSRPAAPPRGGRAFGGASGAEGAGPQPRGRDPGRTQPALAQSYRFMPRAAMRRIIARIKVE
jgi:NAD(P)-dependent dehydrogenase (short-subunit alcohol dehydrogenase family)